MAGGKAIVNIEVALKEYGVTEVPGALTNPRITQYFNDLGLKYNEETSWCSCFANWVCMKAGLPRSGALNARSWLSVGTKVDIPELGDVVVFWRESPTSWMGHVSFFIREDKDYIYCLGGNQSDSVCIARYPKWQLLGYRRLA